MVPDSGTIPRISDSPDFAGLAEKSCLRFTSSHGAPLLLHPSDADLLHALQPQYRLPAIARRRARSAPLWDLARDQSPRTRAVPDIEGRSEVRRVGREGGRTGRIRWGRGT